MGEMKTMNFLKPNHGKLLVAMVMVLLVSTNAMRYEAENLRIMLQDIRNVGLNTYYSKLQAAGDAVKLDDFEAGVKLARKATNDNKYKSTTGKLGVKGDLTDREAIS